MTNTLKIFLRFNSWGKLLILFIIAIFLSISEALGFMVLSPFFSLLVDYNESFFIESNNFFVKNIYNYFEITGVNSFLKTYVIFIFFYYLLKFFFTILSLIYNSHFIYEFRNKVQLEILTLFINKPYEFHLDKSSTDKVRFSSDEITNYFNLIVVPSILLTAEIFIIISLMIFAFFYSKVFFVIFISFALLCLLIMKIIRNFIKKIGRIRLNNDLARHQILQQIFAGIKDIIIFSKQKKLLSESLNYTKKISSSDKRYLINESLPRHIIELITILVFCLVFGIFFSNLNFDFQNFFPKIAIYTLIFFRILPSFTRIARGISAMSYAKQIETNLIEHLFSKDLEPKKITKYNFNKEILIKFIEYKYPKAENSIKFNSEIKIQKGTFNCLVGSSGIGKTTLFDLLSGLIVPQKSEIYIDDVLVEKMPFKLNTKIGIVHQNIFLFNDTLLRNITFLEKEKIDHNLISKILKVVELEDFIKGLSDGIYSDIGEIGSKISGGQKQRIAIARALYQNPDFILFDEATNALDKDTEGKVLNNIKNFLKKDATFILISHKINDKELFDNIIELER